ncbi:MAG: hypothetical protein R6V86_03595 [Spirochaetia bacterium]
MEKCNYKIRVQGQLDRQWEEWFEGLKIEYESDGSTIFSGPLEDQAALFGLLKKIRDLGLRLLSVENQEELK